MQPNISRTFVQTIHEARLKPTRRGTRRSTARGRRSRWVASKRPVVVGPVQRDGLQTEPVS